MLCGVVMMRRGDVGSDDNDGENYRGVVDVVCGDGVVGNIVGK